ncbi:MAG TPA: adenylate/guanylate cyclase domain-containing protein [Gaiellaceae bacterium]
MAEFQHKNFAAPDQTLRLPRLTAELVEIGELTVGYLVTQPGWRWSVDVRPTVGGEWCRARHVGVVLSGRVAVQLQDGELREFGPNDVFDIPPGHDGWTLGDEPCVQIEWAGLHTFAGLDSSLQGRALLTLLFTDLVDSTRTAARLGDRAWRELLTSHFQATRAELDRFGGREVVTTGDGMFATFDGPARALHCAEAIRRAARRAGLSVRAGVHVGEVELVGRDVRGVAVHEASRIMGQAAADEILVSDTTRVLALTSGLPFEDRGTHELKGLAGEWRLHALALDFDAQG